LLPKRLIPVAGGQFSRIAADPHFFLARTLVLERILLDKLEYQIWTKRDNTGGEERENMNAFKVPIKLLQLFSFKSLVGFLLLVVPLLGLLVFAGL